MAIIAVYGRPQEWWTREKFSVVSPQQKKVFVPGKSITKPMAKLLCCLCLPILTTSHSNTGKVFAFKKHFQILGRDFIAAGYGWCLWHCSPAETRFHALVEPLVIKSRRLAALKTFNDKLVDEFDESFVSGVDLRPLKGSTA